MPQRSTILAALILVGLCVLVYLPALEAGFIWEDNYHVWDNPMHVRVPPSVGLSLIWSDPQQSPQYYPLTHTLWWAAYQWFGVAPRGYHVINLVLHIGVALLLWRVLRQLRLPGRWTAWWVAMIFAVHPVHAGTVMWVTQTKTLLSALLALWCVSLFLRFDPMELGEHAQPRLLKTYRFCLLIFVLALLAKTTMVVVPVALLILFWYRRGRADWKDLLAVSPMLLFAAVLGGLATYLERTHVGASGPDWSLSFAQRCIIAGHAVWFYLGKLLWPTDLSFIYTRWTVDAGDWRNYLWPGLLLIVLLGCWLGRRRLGRGPLAALLLFIVLLAPALGFINFYPMRFSFVADHYQYVASMAILTLVVASLFRLAGKAHAAIPTVVLIGVVAAMSLQTRAQTARFQNRVALWSDTVRKNPTGWLGHVQLGQALLDEHDPAGAVTAFRRAAKLAPEEPEPMFNLAIALRHLGHGQSPPMHFMPALVLDPDTARRYDAYAAGHADRDTPEWLEQAMGHFIKQLDPQTPQAGLRNLLGVLGHSLGRDDLAVQYFQRALEDDANLWEARFNLGNVLLLQGKAIAAVTELRETLDQRPTLIAARVNLAAAWLARSDPPGAITVLQPGLEQNRDDANLNLAMGYAWMRQGNYLLAIFHLRKVVADWPEHLDARLTMARCMLLDIFERRMIGFEPDREPTIAMAIKQIDQAKALAPDAPEVATLMGSALLMDHQLDAAEAQLRRAIRLDENHANAYEMLGQVLIRKYQRKLRQSHEAAR